MKTSDCFSTSVTEDFLFGSSESMQRLRGRVEKFAHALVPVLIQGEIGVGKELLARFIHRQSSRRERCFIKVSCTEEKDPSFQRTVLCAADGSVRGNAPSETGTIRFDAVGELGLGLQAKLVKLLDNQVLQNVQILCTTRVPLKERVEAGALRGDLYHRINATTICVPPLRERRVDIPLLALHFLKQYADAYECPARPFSARLMQLFLVADWAGNVLELESVYRSGWAGQRVGVIECH